MIEVQHLTKTYGKKENKFAALKDVNFDITTGSTVAIVGKSGSGKSTLLHLISGLDSPTSGSVIIDEQPLFKLKAKAMDAFRATKMSFIFQAFFIEANQTCYENVCLPLEIAKVPRRKRKAMVLSALKAVELEDKSDTSAGSLSGGQKQRLAIARAIVNNPTILFADEPTGNLDSQTGETIMKLLFDLNKELGCTLLLVTHDHELAARCQQIVTIKDGEILSVTRAKARAPKGAR